MKRRCKEGDILPVLADGMRDNFQRIGHKLGFLSELLFTFTCSQPHNMENIDGRTGTPFFGRDTVFQAL
jgi:hypothetical protein